MHEHTYEHTLVNIFRSATHEYDHILEHTHTHTPVTTAINYYIPASRLEIALAWTAPSHIPHSNFSQTSSLSSPYSSVFLSVNRGCGLIGEGLTGHRYFLAQIAALGHELSLTFPPPISTLSASSQSPRSFPFSCPQLSFRLDSPFLKISFPLYSLNM